MGNTEQVGRLVNLRKFRMAYRAASAAAQANPKNAERQQELALAATLVGDYQTAFSAYNSAEKCPNVTSEILGHMARDLALYWVRRGGAAQATYWVAVAVSKHGANPELMAVLYGVQGQIATMRGNYAEAQKWHAEADAALKEPQWRYNNLIAWLNAVRRGGTKEQAQVVFGRIRTECPLGAKSRMWQAYLLMLPGGPQLYAKRGQTTVLLRRFL